MVKFGISAALALVACSPAVAFLPHALPNMGTIKIDTLFHKAARRSLSEGPRSLAAAAGGCPSIGQTCSSMSEALRTCIGTNSGAASVVPGYCNYTLAVAASESNGYRSYNNGTCLALSPAAYDSAVYGQACSTAVQFGCDSSGQLTCPDPGNGGTASTCAAANPSYGDPCVSHLDCRGSLPAESAPLMCNTALKQCISNSSITSCRRDTDCNATSFCAMGTTCMPKTPLGAACPISGSWNGACADGGYCYNNTKWDPMMGSLWGVCTAPNTMATGTVAWGPYSDMSWFYAAYWGTQLCASGLAVPVANASGFPSGQFRCVAAIDYSQQGAPCDSCNWIVNNGVVGALPVNPSNPALVCAPTNQSATPCRLLPASIYTPEYAAGNVPLQACLNSATGPLTGAVRCATSGGCVTAMCSGVQSQLYTTLFGTGGKGIVSSIWDTYFPGQFPFLSMSPCQFQSIQDMIAYATRTNRNWCEFPAAFTNAGWPCRASPVTATASPAPVTPTPTSTVTPGLTPTASPTASVTSGLTPTASPVYPSSMPKSGAASTSAPAAAMALLAVAAVVAARAF